MDCDRYTTPLTKLIKPCCLEEIQVVSMDTLKYNGGHTGMLLRGDKSVGIIFHIKITGIFFLLRHEVQNERTE